MSYLSIKNWNQSHHRICSACTDARIPVLGDRPFFDPSRPSDWPDRGESRHVTWTVTADRKAFQASPMFNHFVQAPFGSGSKTTQIEQGTRLKFNSILLHANHAMQVPTARPPVQRQAMNSTHHTRFRDAHSPHDKKVLPAPGHGIMMTDL